MTIRAEIAVSLASKRWQGAVAAPARLARAAAAAALDGAAAAGCALPAAAELSVVLGDDALVRRLNRTYRGKDAPTNVLSFPALAPAELARAVRGPSSVILGDVVAAFETSRREAAALKKPLAHHLAHLVVHGTLHLLGYDHEAEGEAARMERLEGTVLRHMGVPDPYARHARARRPGGTPAHG